MSLDFFVKDMKNLSSFWDMMSIEEKKRTIRMTTESIIVSNTEPDIIINMKYQSPATSFETVSRSEHNHIIAWCLSSESPKVFCLENL